MTAGANQDMRIKRDIYGIKVFERLTKNQLLNILTMSSKNWITLDGLWFTLIEDEFGLETAVKLDKRMWEKQAVIEARRIKNTVPLKQKGVLRVIEAINYLTASLSFGYDGYEFRDTSFEKATYIVKRCAPQEARIRGGRQVFPCKEVTSSLLSNFAKTIVPQVTVECIFCRPDDHPKEQWCQWEFKMMNKEHG